MTETGSNLPPGQMAARGPGFPPPMAQRWQCAPCVSARFAWEQANRETITDAMAKAAGSGQPAASFLPPDLLARIPPVAEAVTMATLPGHGPALVCPGHCPQVADGTRPPLLVAPAGLNFAQFAAR